MTRCGDQNDDNFSYKGISISICAFLGGIHYQYRHHRVNPLYYQGNKLTCRGINAFFFNQVPRHLFLSGRLSELNQCVLFSYEWLYNKTKALSLEHVLADFILNPGVEATLVERALR